LEMLGFNTVRNFKYHDAYTFMWGLVRAGGVEVKRSFSFFLVSIIIVSLLLFHGSVAECSDPHDVAIVDVEVSHEDNIYPGMNVSVFVIVENQGENYETFNVTAYIGNFTIKTLNVTDLQPGSNTTLIFEWEAFQYRMQIFPPPWINPLHIMTGMLPLRVEAEIVPGEVDTTDNVYYHETVNVMWMVPDVDGNGKIDMRDIGRAARAFGSSLGDPSWDSIVDFNSDQQIDMRDVGTSARLFGTEYVSPWIAVEGGNRGPNCWLFIPSPETVNGTQFNVNITIKGLNRGWNLYNATTHMIFNDTLIQFHNITFSQLWTSTIYNYTPGIAGVSLGEISMTVKDPFSTPSEDTLIATIAFNVTFREGNYDDTLLDLCNITFFDEYQIPSEQETDGLVGIFHSPPYYPNMAVRNATTGGSLWRYGPDPPRAVGELFNASVVVENLNSVWNLYNTTFQLAFNDTVLLEIGNIYFNQVWETTSYTYTPGAPGVSLGELRISVEDPESAPSGDVLIVIITFRVTYQGWSPPYPVGYSDDSPLDLHDIVLFDQFQEIPTDPAVDGVVKIFTLRG